MELSTSTYATSAEVVIAHLLAQTSKDSDGCGPGMIRLHKVLYFSYGTYLFLIDSIKKDHPTFNYVEVPFENTFVCGKFGPIIKEYLESSVLYSIEPKVWTPATLREQLFYGVLTKVAEVLDQYGDFELVELALEGSAFEKNYVYENPKLFPIISYNDILEEFQERFV